MLKIELCEGFNPDEAFQHLAFKPNERLVSGCNATQAWRAAGAPKPGSNKFKQFAARQLDIKTRNRAGLGLYIVLEPPIHDIRKRPYSIINCKASATRQWKFVYMIREDELDVSKINLKEVTDEETGEVINKVSEVEDIIIIKPGPMIQVCDSKTEAVNLVKDLITAYHKNYTILPIKIPDIDPISAYGIYTPSAKTRKGIYVAFGITGLEDD